MRKVQFIEAYNIGGSQSIIRSFNPGNALPTVTTHFHKSVADTIWQAWYYAAQGNRGMIGWVENWFDGKTPRPWHRQVGPHYRELGERIGPLLSGAEWLDDGVVMYYSHPSIQMSWILDAEAHGKTWPNRNGDHRLGTSHLVRKAWTTMLRDEGLQFSWFSYVDLVQQEGFPEGTKVVILPAAYCLSASEAVLMKSFVKQGGTLVADFLPGVFDQHGRAHALGGVLDDVFGVEHPASLRAGDVFGEKLWVEADQDAHFSWKSYEQLLSSPPTCLKHESGFNLAVRSGGIGQVREVGRGQAVCLNLSPQWYNAYRLQGREAAQKRSSFMQPVREAGAVPWVRLAAPGQAIFGYEITYWQKEGRVILFVIPNPETRGSSLGGGNSVSLPQTPVRLKMAFKEGVTEAKNERTGELLGGGRVFDLTWECPAALIVSFDALP